MKTKTVKIEDFKKEIKKRERKEAFKRKVNDAVTWCRENRDILGIAIPVGVAAVGGVTKVTAKAINAHNLNKEQKYKDTTIYDHSLGRYVHLKHKLSPSEALSIEERRAGGEKLHVILNDMNLLK